MAYESDNDATADENLSAQSDESDPPSHFRLFDKPKKVQDQGMKVNAHCVVPRGKGHVEERLYEMYMRQNQK